MAVQFSRTDPLGVALEKTFSGQHPCSLCQVVDEGRKAEKKAEFQNPQTKLDFFCEDSRQLDGQPLPFVHPTPPHHYWSQIARLPAIPPPKFA